MDEPQYLQQIESRLAALLSKREFANERSQIRSKNLLTRLSPEAIEGIDFTINEERAWIYARYLISSSIHILEATQRIGPRQSLALRTAGEILEQMSDFSSTYDRAELRLLSALAYYTAGYQANSICMVRDLASRVQEWKDSPLSPIPFVYDAVRAFLERDLASLLRITDEGKSAVEPSQDVIIAQVTESGVLDLSDVLSLAGMRLVLDSLFLSAEYSLAGKDESFQASLEAIRSARDSFIAAGDVVSSNLATNLIGVLMSLYTRATWQVLKSRRPTNAIWEKYLTILARQTPAICEFWPSQISAISSGVIDTPGSSFVVRMPTSAGKTRVAELAIMSALEANPHKKCIYIAPFRALSDEIQRSLSSTIGQVGFRVTTTVGTYDTDEFRDFLTDRCSVLVGTPEKIDLLYRTRPEFFDDVSLVVIDEGHIVDDTGRGPRIELLLTRLKRRLQKINARFLCISAVMPNPEDFALWLCDSPERIISTSWRPARQRLAKFSWSGDYGRVDYMGATAGQLQFVPRLIISRDLTDFTPKTRKPKSTRFPNKEHKGETSAELALKLCREGPVLIFCAQTPWVKSTGNTILRALKLFEQSGIPTPLELDPLERSESLSVALEWLGEDHPLIPCLRRRIGLHNRRLPESVRQAVEDDFRKGVLRILVSTNTLGQGVNLPLRYVLVHSVQRWIEDENEEDEGHLESIKVRDYWNICGRAGRAKDETEGQIFHIVHKWSDQQLLDLYSQQAQIEPTLSAFIKLLRDLVAHRIGDEQLYRYLDSQVISMLVEEGVEVLTEAQIRTVFSSSLMGVQSLRLGYDITPLVQGALRISNFVGERTRDPALRKLFSGTGLSYTSCVQLMERANNDLQRFLDSRDRDASEQIDLFVTLGIAAARGISEAGAVDRFSGDTDNLMSLALEWVHGTSVQTLRTKYWPGSSDSEEASQYIEESFASALPWVLNAYYRFVDFQMRANGIAPPFILGYIATMIRFGLDRVDACWARSAGAPSRQSAVAIANSFRLRYPDGSFATFIDWFESLTEHELETIEGLADFQARRILAQRV